MKVKIIFKVIFLLAVFLVFFSGKTTKTTLSADEQQRIVAAHNKYRSKVKVPDIQWSDELAVVAQKWANHLAKKSCRMKHSNNGKYGENIYWSSYESTPEEVVDSWGSEKKYYKGGKINRKVYKYGHYTQMVWAKTKFVGCGRAKCRNGAEIWVCNYSPPGNIIGKKTYSK
jgi:pathogenesis-related protein 1